MWSHQRVFTQRVCTLLYSLVTLLNTIRWLAKQQSEVLLILLQSHRRVVHTHSHDRYWLTRGGSSFLVRGGGFNLEGIGNELASLTRWCWRHSRGSVWEGVNPLSLGGGSGGGLPPEKFSKFGYFLLQSRCSSPLLQGQDSSPNLTKILNLQVKWTDYLSH